MTTLGGVKARCRFDFGDEGKLVGVRCVADPPRGEGQAYADGILSGLVTKYGPGRTLPTSARGAMAALEWRSDDAVLRYALDDFGIGMIVNERVTLENFTRQHWDAIVDAKARAKRGRRAARERAEQARAEAQRARRQRILDGQRALDADLGGAPEQPPR